MTVEKLEDLLWFSIHDAPTLNALNTNKVKSIFEGPTRPRTVARTQCPALQRQTDELL